MSNLINVFDYEMYVIIIKRKSFDVSMEKKRYKYIDTFRAILCIAVLLYHLDLLQGGFLAVCCFFVLSGYLATNSLLGKDNVDLGKYYFSRFKKVYLPLLIVVFASVGFFVLQQDAVWVSLKPETTSVLLGYNNFWQINANLDYFARHTSSPFTHLWYMAILLQFELVYPIFFVLLQKTKSISRHIPMVFTGMLAIGFSVWFYMYSYQAPISAVYYNTFARVFSLFIGVSACFVYSYFDKYDFLKDKKSIFGFWSCIILLIFLFVFVGADSEWFACSMIASSLISCIVIVCSFSNDVHSVNFFDKLFKWISDISYEVYLVQYPVIYFYQLLMVNQEDVYGNALVISLITILISLLIHFVLSKDDNKKKIKLVLSLFVLFVSVFGGYQYIIAKDHTEEMKRLEEELAAHAEEMEKQNIEYEEKLKEENDAWEQLLAQLEPDKEAIKQTVSRLSVICVGDSVMLGAAPNLNSKFVNGYVDAKVSRSGWAMAEIIKSLKVKGPVVIHAGTNGDVPEYVKDGIMKHCGNNDVFWLTVTNDKDVNVNEKLKKFVNKYENAYLVDWQQYSKGHTDWFYSDRIHLRSAGKEAYTTLIFNSIYEAKLNELENIKNNAIKERENEMKKKISFIGNDLLLGIYNQVHDTYAAANFMANKQFDKDVLLNELYEANEQETLHYNVVLVMDASFEMDNETFARILDICKDKKLYIFTTASYEEVSDPCIFSLNGVLKENPHYYRPDKLRLNEQGNVVLCDLIINTLSNEIENESQDVSS